MAAAAGALVFAGVPAASAGAPGNGSLGVSPLLSGRTTLEYNHFSYALPPGAHVADGIRITSSTGRVNADVYTADLAASPSGGYSVGQRTKAPTGVGHWIHLVRNHIEVTAGHPVVVPFWMSVPTAFPPGDYLGAVVVSDYGPPTPTGLRVERRIALIVRVHVLGSISRRLAINNFHYDSAKHVFSLDVRNSGNVLESLAGEINVDGTRILLPLKGTETYVIPGGATHTSAIWLHPPIFGRIHAIAEITGTVPGAPPLRVESQRLTFWIIPWAPIAIALGGAVVLIALGVAARHHVGTWLRRRAAWRRHKRSFMKDLRL